MQYVCNGDGRKASWKRVVAWGLQVVCSITVCSTCAAESPEKLHIECRGLGSMQRRVRVSWWLLEEQVVEVIGGLMERK